MSDRLPDYARAPSVLSAGGLAALLVRRAAHSAPPHLTARLEEEWLADMLERRGATSRLRFALGCCRAALLIGGELVAATAPARASPEALPVGPLAVPPRAKPFPRGAATTGGTVVCEINTTPLIDVMLVLLVTLIVSLPLMTHAVKIDLPQVPLRSQTPPPPVIDLEIDSDGTVLWNGAALANAQQLESYLRTAAQTQPQPEIHLRAERRAKYDYVARVLAAAQRSGMKQVSFADTATFRD